MVIITDMKGASANHLTLFALFALCAGSLFHGPVSGAASAGRT